MESFKAYRHRNNPQEKLLHDKFLEQYINETYLDFLIFPAEDGDDGMFISTDTLSKREQKIVLSTVQWLGSPLGRQFLSSCGYKLEKDGE